MVTGMSTFPGRSRSATGSSQTTPHPGFTGTQASSRSVRTLRSPSHPCFVLVLTSPVGEWPITLGSTTTRHAVYLSEENHFDVVLGRSFMERRSVKTDNMDLTNVICMDTGEKIDCEVVIIRDGKGEYVTVT